MATPTFVWDSSVNKSILAFYNSVTGLPVFMDETTGLPTDVTDRDARILGRTKIHDGTNVLDVLIQDSAFGTVSKGLAVFGKYQVTPTTYTDGDAAPILLDANGRITLSSDIQIGAVELKDADTDGRANIKAANTARTTGTLVIATQPIDAAGAVLSTSALALEAGNLASVKTAVELIDNFISGTRGLVTEDNSASIKTAVEAVNAKINTEITSDYDTGAGVQTMKLVGVALPASGGAVAGGTATNPIRTDPTGTTTQPISAVSLPLPTDAATQTTLALIKAKTDNLDTALSGVKTGTDKIPAVGQALMAASTPVVIASNQSAVPISGTVTANLGTIADVATQTTLALVKAKTDNIDVAASTLATSAKQDLQPLAATTPTLFNVPMTLADTEYSQVLPANTKILEFREQSTGFVTRYAFAAGKVAAPTAPYRTLDIGEVKTVEGLNLAAATLYFACSTAGKVMEIECWS